MKRILVIDDSLVICNLLKEFLFEDGYDVQFTNDPFEGTIMALEEEWSMIICDTHMPGKNGYEVYSDIATKKPNLPFLITDSLPEDLEFVQNRVKGNYHYLKKPFELDQVRQIMESCLKTVNTK